VVKKSKAENRQLRPERGSQIGSQDSQLEAFFISYNKQRGKKFKVTGTAGPKKAIKFLKAGIKARKKPRKGNPFCSVPNHLGFDFSLILQIS